MTSSSIPSNESTKRGTELAIHEPRISVSILLLTAVFLYCTVSQAQDTTLSAQPGKAPTPASRNRLLQDTVPPNERMDLIDVFQTMLKKNPAARKKTNNMNLSVMPAFGYSLQTGYAGVVSSNLGFYSKQEPKGKISSILTSVTYTQYRQIIFPIQANIWTKNERYNIITDWRYLKYPSNTFGLGGHSNISNGYTIDFNYSKFHETLLRKISGNLFAGIGFYFDYFWKIKEVNPPAGITTAFQRYGLRPTASASGMALRLLLDTRANQINPAQGWYINIVGRPNFTFLGSDNNWQSLLLEGRRYFALGTHSHTILAFWTYNWLTLGGKPPYLMLPSTGWDDFYNTGRGYVQGRYRGRDMLYLESELRFQITNDGLLGGVIFANAQSFSKTFPKQLSVIAPGEGIGIRIKMNKFSGANLCVDYGFGTDGSKGISVNLGEVF